MNRILETLKIIFFVLFKFIILYLILKFMTNLKLNFIEISSIIVLGEIIFYELWNFKNYFIGFFSYIIFIFLMQFIFKLEEYFFVYFLVFFEILVSLYIKIFLKKIPSYKLISDL